MPTVTLAAPAPALAASPCAGIVLGQPLPASAFTVTYLCITDQIYGGVQNRLVYVDFGFKINDACASLVGSGRTITSSNTGNSRFRLSNGTTYNGTNGGSVPANGTTGTVDGGCRSGLNGTQACGTTGLSPYNLANSTGTNTTTVTAASISRSVTVSGYGTTTLYLNGSGFPGSGTNANNCAPAGTLSVTSAPNI